MKEFYRETNFGPAAREKIRQANAIIDEYVAAGFTLTLRQLYYQFVARDLIPNTQREYQNLARLISKGRLAGLISWEAIEDRTRALDTLAHWTSPREIMQAVTQQYRVDRWATQPKRVEVWVEKEALVGVIEPTCRAYDVPFFACRGYTSQSEQWRAGQRFKRYIEEDGQTVVVLHLGDHDPSGIDMTRDNRDRLEMFIGEYQYDSIEVIRLALNMDQVREYRPPPNPAKFTDSRVGKYVSEFGRKCWELDALDPKVIAALIEANINRFIDAKKWKASAREEKRDKKRLEELTATL